MFEALAFPFMQRALAAGLLISLVAGYLGPLVVQRRMSFLGSGLSHAAFGGVAVGLFLGLEPLWVAAPFTVAVALAITWLSARGVVTSDTAIGVFFSVSVALGVVFLALRQQYTADAFAYLFGSILTVQTRDLWAALALVGLAALSLPLWGRWAYATFDRDLARADGQPVARDDLLLSALTALTVVVSVKVLGALLVTAFLVIPAATARQSARSFAQMTWVAVALSVASTAAGLALSYLFDAPSGAVIVLTQAALFVAFVTWRWMRHNLP